MNLKGLCIGRWKRTPKANPGSQVSKKPKKQPKVNLVRFPWEQTTKQALMKRKKMMMSEREDPASKIKRMRIKFPERHKPVTIGPGYPSIGLVYANMAIARGEKERKILKKTQSGNPLIFEPLNTEMPRPVPDSVFAEFCRRIGIEQYEVKNEVPEHQNALDLKSFDLYWEDIRIERDLIVKELKHLPLMAPISIQDLTVLEKAIYKIATSCYYSPSYSHKKSEDVIHLMVWFLNRRNLPIAFIIKVLQAVSLIVYQSAIFKRELVRCGGVRVLYRVIQIGLITCPLQASWACYALTMASFGSPDVIRELQKIRDFDETIGEMTFGMYWYYWPTNFAHILQSAVFGPGGVANSMEIFEFL